LYFMVHCVISYLTPSIVYVMAFLESSTWKKKQLLPPIGNNCRQFCTSLVQSCTKCPTIISDRREYHFLAGQGCRGNSSCLFRLIEDHQFYNPWYLLTKNNNLMNCIIISIWPKQRMHIISEATLSSLVSTPWNFIGGHPCPNFSWPSTLNRGSLEMRYRKEDALSLYE
jgi:hypothetical protein